jgi:hypothetical protein
MGSMIIPGITSLVQNILNYQLTERENAASLARARESMGMLDEFASGFDTSTLTRGMPTILMGGRKFGLPGADPNSIMDLDTAYGSVGSAADRFEQEYGDGYDFDALSGRVEGILSGAWMDRGKAAHEVGKLFGEKDFGEYLNQAMGEIGAASEVRARQASDRLLGEGFRSGRSLEEMQGGLGAIDYGESMSRSTQAQGARAKQEEMQTGWDAQRVGAQSSAWMRQGELNTALAQAQAEAETNIGITDAGTQFNRAAKTGELAFADEQLKQESRDTMMDQFIQSFVLPTLQINASDLSSKMALKQHAASILSGWQGVLPQFDFSDFISAYGAKAAAKAGRPPKPSPFSFSAMVNPGDFLGGGGGG